MPDQHQHPSNEELSAFTLGQLPPQQAQEVESHISKCDPCCETMMTFDSDNDTFVGLLKEVGTGTHFPFETAGERVAGSDDEIPEPLLSHSRYQVERIVGRGGMGRVFKARHRMMDRAVALKVIHSEYVRRQEAIDRFRREVKAAASLDHPNIVTAHDAEHVDDLHFLVMEYVDGVDLSETVKQRGPLPVTEACHFIRQAAEGLQYAHDRGMVHRDIKPHNLMVTSDGTLKILDFGLASLAPQPTREEPLSDNEDGNLTIAGSIMGTPDFISPEQAQDAHKVDGRSDIYSLGMTLYFLLAGRVPFSEGSATDKLKLHAEANPAKLEGLRTDIPEGVQKIFDRMTAKDPAERFQSPQEVVDALRDCFDGPPVSGVRPSHGESGRFRWWLVAAVLLIGSLSLVAYQNPDFLSWRVAKEGHVYAPISELESYVAAMAASPHELVFMNVYDLGPDQVSLGFKASKDGLLVDIDVSSVGLRRSRGKYANRMKEIAATLSVPVTEQSDIAEDGSIKSVQFGFFFTGEPATIAANVQKIVTEGVALNDEVVLFQCRNFPDRTVIGNNYSPRLVSSEEFVAEYQEGHRVFLGEDEQHIFLVPETRRNELPLTMDDDVWFTDVRDLPPGFAAQLRRQAADEWHRSRVNE